jgi:hypothetical protein
MVVSILWCGVCVVVCRVVRDGALQHVIIVTENHLFKSSSNFLRRINSTILCSSCSWCAACAHIVGLDGSNGSC